jgi:hypothetical protein
MTKTQNLTLKLNNAAFHEGFPRENEGVFERALADGTSSTVIAGPLQLGRQHQVLVLVPAKEVKIRIDMQAMPLRAGRRPRHQFAFTGCWGSTNWLIFTKSTEKSRNGAIRFRFFGFLI